MEPDELGTFSDTYSSGNRKKKVKSDQDTNNKIDTTPPSPPPSTPSRSSSTNTAAKSSYNLGVGKNRPFGQGEDEDDSDTTKGANKHDITQHWMAPTPVEKPEIPPSEAAAAVAAAASSAVLLPKEKLQAFAVTNSGGPGAFVKKRKMVARDNASQKLRGAIWDEEHYGNRDSEPVTAGATSSAPNGIQRPKLFYPDLDMSIPSHIYNETYDAVWELLQWEAYQEAQREPLLVSFLYSTILNHGSLESSLAFLLANRLSSPMLISTQLQSFILEALGSSAEFRHAVRADMLAVRDRDPACTCLPDVFLYFKGEYG